MGADVLFHDLEVHLGHVNLLIELWRELGALEELRVYAGGHCSRQDCTTELDSSICPALLEMLAARLAVTSKIEENGRSTGFMGGKSLCGACGSPGQCQSARTSALKARAWSTRLTKLSPTAPAFTAA